MAHNENQAIVIIGESGSGISTLGNWLYSLSTGDTQKVFEVGDGLEPLTKTSTFKHIELEGKTYDLIDMPGFFGTNNTQVIEEIIRIIMNYPSGIHAILLVTELGGMTAKLCDKVVLLMGHFGPDLISNVILVVSKVGRQQTIERTLLENILKSEGSSASILRRMENRWVISPNADIFDSNDENWHREANILMEKIQSIQKPYTEAAHESYKEKQEIEKKKHERNRSLTITSAVAVGTVAILL